MSDVITLVNEYGKMTGTVDKMQAHLKGTLHSAFSVFIFNTDGQLLLQQRAAGKYHSGGKWTNTCCSHPKAGEPTKNAAHRRLKEEMGFEWDLEEVFTFRYCETLENGLIENELDHVFFGTCNLIPTPDPAEVMDYKYMDMELLERDLKANPDEYTVWLKICFGQVMQHYKQKMTYELPTT